MFLEVVRLRRKWFKTVTALLQITWLNPPGVAIARGRGCSAWSPHSADGAAVLVLLFLWLCFVH